MIAESAKIPESNFIHAEKTIARNIAIPSNAMPRARLLFFFSSFCLSPFSPRSQPDFRTAPVIYHQ
jgi:hypothetical protein